MGTPKLPVVVGQVYELLEQLEQDDRNRVIHSVFALLGEGPATVVPAAGVGNPARDGELPLGMKARRWLTQNHVSEPALQDIFHFHSGNVEVIAAIVPGDSKRAKTRSCYLLCGIRALLATDDAGFQDNEAVELCQHMHCYDSPNHSNARKSLGLAGNKDSGFTLTAPLLREAAELIKQMGGK